MSSNFFLVIYAYLMISKENYQCVEFREGLKLKYLCINFDHSVSDDFNELWEVLMKMNVTMEFSLGLNFQEEMIVEDFNKVIQSFSKLKKVSFHFM